ncbi:MAG: alkaline phosphatase family protein [Nevskia sp.]|nr:alkaline phosphatase family protein [Nevskia sp.]
MKKILLAAGAAALFTAGSVNAAQGPVPAGIPALDHVFVIMMENHAYAQIAGNPQAPFINSMMAKANVANNYYAIAHPSSTNYLEVVGGSNFNNLSDQYPNWHNTTCVPNIVPGQPTNTDNPSTGTVCPISGKNGKDAATPVVDNSDNETSAPPLTNIDGVASIPASTNIDGISIADQLVAAGRSWKSYQEGLPLIGADGVNVSDGFYSIGGNNAAGTSVTSDFAALSTTGNPVSASNVVFLYAVKHNPFAYFASVQSGQDPRLSLNQIVSFEGQHGLYADLKEGTVPSLAFIAPNQCDDMHGRGNGTAFCNYDADDNGTPTGLNPSLILQGDLSVQRIVTAIKASPVWSTSRSAIVVVWDENDYSTVTSNKVVLIVDTNYGTHKVQSSKFYDHYSLTKTLDGAFGLHCLNHACDAGTNVMSDLFQAEPLLDLSINVNVGVGK